MVKQFAYCKKLRCKLFHSYHRKPKKLRKVLLEMKVGTSTITRWIKYNKLYGVPLSLSEIFGGKRTGIKYQIGHKESEYLIKILNNKSILYLDEIKKHLVLKYKNLKNISIATVYRAIQRLDYTCKKLYTLASNYDFYKETLFWHKIQQNHVILQNTYWLDESSYNNKITNRKNGWSKIGERAIFRVLFSKGARYSIIATCNHNGIVAYQIISRTCNFSLFFEHIIAFVLPILTINNEPKYLILDNCSIHKNEYFIKLLSLFNIKCIFLSPYSPHLNPMELYFNIVKQKIKKDYEKARKYPIRTLCNIMEELKTTSIKQWLVKTPYVQYCICLS